MLRKERKEEREIEKGRKETINSSEQFVLLVFFFWNYFKWENKKKKLMVTGLYR